MHSWAVAIDINPQWNGFGQKKFEMGEDLARCFEDVGFVWGGRWTGSPDAIIFSMLQLGKAVDTKKALIKSGLLFCG